MNHAHAKECGCVPPRGRLASVLRTLVPIGACSVCPACLATYAKLLALAGISAGIALTETQHTLVLGGACCVVLAMAVWRARRERAYLALAVAVNAVCLLALAHIAGDIELIEWVGCGLLVLSNFIRPRRILSPRYVRVRPSPSFVRLRT